MNAALARVGLLIIVLLASPWANATRTPADLVEEGKLQLGSSIVPGEAIVPGQKLKLQLDIATQRWFGGGTRIAIPEVPGLVILQTESFASNASEQRAGITWVVQRWTLDVYPQRAGRFSIPPLTVTVNVNDAEDGNIAGEIKVPGVAFEAAIPPALERAEFWVASPDFTVSQEVDRSLDNLAPGDAFQRTIRFQASDVMAMMLPTFSPSKIEGIAAYPLPPELDNRSNRGQASATRIERISYVAQQAGTVTLPALEFMWWNTNTESLELLTLPALEITISGAGATAQEDMTATDWRHLALSGAVVLALLCLAVLLYLMLRKLPWQRLMAPVEKGWQILKSLRQPALPPTLNPRR